MQSTSMDYLHEIIFFLQDGCMASVNDKQHRFWVVCGEEGWVDSVVWWYSQASQAMAATLHHGNQYFLKDSVCQVECIIVDDREDNEEDILFINVGCSSVSTQTESQDFDTPQPNIPGVPIFYCGQPSPGIATTQCLIPHLSDACVGPDSPGACSDHHRRQHPPDKPAASSFVISPTTSYGDVAVKTEVIPVTQEGEHK